MKKINLNDHVKVKLTDSGKDIFYHQYDQINAKYGKEVCKSYYPKEDSDGFIRIQLWELMQIYGPAILMGMRYVPFELNAIYFEDDVLVDL